MLLLKTLAGSKLHGLSSVTSDTDIFEVYSSPEDFNTSGKVEVQKFQDNIDRTQMTLSVFMEHAMAGSHQSLDAMFSTIAEVDHISAFRSGFIAGSGTVHRLIGTIHELLLKREPKKYRHAVRIALNTRELITTGRYTPTLTAEQAERVIKIAYQPYEVVLQEIAGIVPFIQFRSSALVGVSSVVATKLRGE
jgi:hypothetical protein